MNRFIRILLILTMTAGLMSCASRKEGRGCDCPTFGQANTHNTHNTMKGIPYLRYKCVQMSERPIFVTTFV